MCETYSFISDSKKKRSRQWQKKRKKSKQTKSNDHQKEKGNLYMNNHTNILFNQIQVD